MDAASLLSEINTALPATIIDYNPSTVRATVKPTLPKRLNNGETLQAPQIVNVPVCFPMADISGTVAQITLPLKAGDGVLLIFCQRSLENWLSGNEVAPDDPRQFDLSDAFAIPSTNARSPAADAANLCLRYGKGSIKITPSGDVLIDASSTTVTAPNNTFIGDVLINGNVQLNGDMNSSGSITATGEVGGKGISLSSHVHEGVESGNKRTGTPK